MTYPYSSSLKLPTNDKKESFKAQLRTYKPLFSSNILGANFYEISPIVTNVVSGIAATTKVDVPLFDFADTITVGAGATHVSGDNLIYLPGLEGDGVYLNVGSSTAAINFTSTGINIGGYSFGLNQGFAIGDKFFTVKGIGGLLIQGGNPPAGPTYTVTQSATSVDEGGSVTFTVNTTNVPDATTLYYSLSGTATANDFVGGTMAGSFTITNNTGNFTVNVVGDVITDDGENFTANIRTDSTSGTIVGSSLQVTISDVSLTEAITQSATTINEGDLITFTVSTSGYPTGYTFYWDIQLLTGGITSSDFNDGLLSGTITTNSSGQAFLSKQLVQDRITEGVEKFKLNIRTGSAVGPILLSSNEVTINDTSVDIGANANGKTFGPVNVNRDGGNTNATSDWYTICGMDSLPDGSKIALFIDTSGSMTMSTIQASYDLLLSKLNARAITIITVTNQNEDWITPFLTDLA
tara:strand:+ start:291 stop:1688 length:1398 start_codon:yes stop_codon:yes gene_type:complete